MLEVLKNVVGSFGSWYELQQMHMLIRLFVVCCSHSCRYFVRVDKYITTVHE